MAGTQGFDVPDRGSGPPPTGFAARGGAERFCRLGGGLPLVKGGKKPPAAGASRGTGAQTPHPAPLWARAGRPAAARLLRWFAIFGTGGTPPEIVARLNGIINTALSDPAISGKLLPQGIVPKIMKVAEFKAFVDAERTKFGKIVDQANIKLSN